MYYLHLLKHDVIPRYYIFTRGDLEMKYNMRAANTIEGNSNSTMLKNYTKIFEILEILGNRNSNSTFLARMK